MKNIAFLMMVICVVGCTGQHCITVGGTYEGVTGDLKYCFDAEATKAMSAPVVVSEKEKYIGVSSSEAKEILSEIEKNEEKTEDGIEAKGINNKVKSIVSRLKTFLKK